MVSQALARAYAQGERCPLKKVCSFLEKKGFCKVEVGQECRSSDIEFTIIGECEVEGEHCTGKAVIQIKEKGGKKVCTTCVYYL